MFGFRAESRSPSTGFPTTQIANRGLVCSEIVTTFAFTQPVRFQIRENELRIAGTAFDRRKSAESKECFCRSLILIH